MNGKILVMTAVEAERNAVLRGVNGDDRFEVQLAGVGPVAAAISTTTALLSGEYRLVISSGIAGGFEGRAEIGDVVVATEIVAADLGVETPEGFSSVDELGFGTSRVQADIPEAGRVVSALSAGGIQTSYGPIVTVNTATGTAGTAARLAARVAGVIAEGMEGYGVAAAAQARGVPALEIRAISNRVGPRDRSAWRIGDALRSLEAAFDQLTEGWQP
ncbi:futalosine hydrolase [Cohnella panacarvi]|uniref:futalosine hydrolase n=1 Tax=Cohnella panacarvi TaxID=400776 RepID=UPI00047951B9|nr:futalosine hydrolase [Cohnella panacarvi]